MDSNSYWPICRRNNGFCWGICDSLPLICAIRIKHGFILAWIGLTLAIMTASAFAVLQAVDGIAQNMTVDSWVAAPPEEKAITYGVVEGIRLLSMVSIVSFVFSKVQWQ